MQPRTCRVPLPQAPGSRERCRVRGARYLVVARDRPDLLGHLRRGLADWPDAEVIADRRYGGGWQRHQRRSVERRRPMSRETDVQARAFLIAPLQAAGEAGA